MSTEPPNVVLVTGGTGGLGVAITQTFLNRGMHVVVPFRSENGAQRLRERAGTAAERLLLVQADATRREALDALVADVTARLGGVSYLVNSAGGWAGGTPLWETHDATYEQMLDVNLRTTFVACRAVLPGMIERGFGRIVNVGSRAALGASPSAAVYGASKAAVVSLTQTLALEVAAHDAADITVNCVLPSVIDTAANRASMGDARASRWVRPEQIAAVIAWLVSPDAQPINGATIPAYGRA